MGEQDRGANRVVRIGKVLAKRVIREATKKFRDGTLDKTNARAEADRVIAESAAVRLPKMRA